MYRAARAAAERAGIGVRLAMTAASLLIALLASGCASISGGPPRLYAIEEEAAIIRGSLSAMNLVEFSRLDEGSRMKYRNDWLAGRMYAMDMQYTAYEAGLTRERQGVGFGAALATIGLTTASTLVTAVATKDILTGTAGAVTGARAAYDNDILLAHGVQWIQTQMQAKRAEVKARILAGMRLSTIEYPLAAALSDLEAYYRAGTFTGGVLSTTAVLAVDAQTKERLVEFDYVRDVATQGPIEEFLLAAGAAGRRQLSAIVRELDPTRVGGIATLLADSRPGAAALRAQVIARARSTIPGFPR